MCCTMSVIMVTDNGLWEEMSFKNTTHWSILQDNFVVGIGSGTTIVYAVERLGQLLRCMHGCDACPHGPK